MSNAWQELDPLKKAARLVFEEEHGLRERRLLNADIPLTPTLARLVAHEQHRTRAIVPELSRADHEDLIEAASVPLFEAHTLPEWELLISLLRPDYLPYSERELGFQRDASRLWKELTSNNRRRRLEAQLPFVDFLCRAFGWRLTKRESAGQLDIAFLDLRVPNLGLPQTVPIVFTYVGIDADSVSDAVDWTESLRQLLLTRRLGGAEAILNIVVGAPGPCREYKELRHHSSIVLFGEAELRTVLLADMYSNQIASLLRSSVSIGRLSPYSPNKPVQSPSMLFGRETEIKTILENPDQDFMIIGSRRIGKSSLLSFLKHSTADSGSRVPILLDCSDISDGDRFAEALMYQVNIKRRGVALGGLAQAVRAQSSTHKSRFLFLLDEADRLVEMAIEGYGWRVFNVLRELSNQGVAQTIVTGYRPLYEAWQALNSPLFNFVTPLHLSVLPEQAARRLVSEPMGMLQVRFAEPRLVSEIVGICGRHPNMLQYFCDKLIMRLDSDRRADRYITAIDVDAVSNHSSFNRFLTRTYENEQNLTSIERLLVLLLVDSKQDDFRVGKIHAQVTRRCPTFTVAQVSDAMEGLELAGLTIRVSSRSSHNEEGAHYRWAIPAFPRAVEQSRPVVRELEEALAEL